MKKRILYLLLRLVQFLFLVAFFVAGMLIALRQMEAKKILETQQVLQEQFFQDESFQVPEQDWSHGLSKINPDYAGWLTIGEIISQPIVQGSDNTHYLKHDIYGECNNHGCCFMDKAVYLDCGGNLLIYGHNMKDGTMFGKLEQLKRGTNFSEHNTVLWQDRNGVTEYRIIAIAPFSAAVGEKDYFELGSWINNISDEAATKMLEKITSQSLVWKTVQHRKGDRYMMVVTCDNQNPAGRLMVLAQKVSTSNDGVA